MLEGNKKVEGTEEEKPKSLIEEIWWVIPPAFIVFVYLPYLYNRNDLGTISFERYIDSFKYLFIDRYSGVLFWLYYSFGLMAVGMLLTRRRSLILRIIVPIIFVILSWYILELVFIFWIKIGIHILGIFSMGSRVPFP
jgi:hypothetical protein